MKLPCSPRRRSEAAVDVVAFGENSLDTLVLGAQGRRVAKLKVAAITDLCGGQAATAAVACARLGWRTRYVGVLGDDPAGHRIRTELTRARVDLHVVTRLDVPTRRAVVLIDDEVHSRSVFESRHPALELAPGEIPDAMLTDSRVLLVDAVDVVASIAAATVARETGVRTIVDVDHAGPRVAELLRHIDVVIVPETAVAELSGVPDVGRGLALIGHESGAAVVVATLGSAGAVGWCQGQEVRVPGRIVTVVDTTGAGDAFRAGFAAAWLGRAPADPDLVDLLADANLVASLNCRSVGAQTGLPTASEVPAHLRGGV